MKYHQPTNSFVVTPETISYIADDLKFLMAQVRKLGDRPLSKYEPLPMTQCDHAQCTLMDIAAKLDIDLGGERYNKIDVSDQNV